MDGPEETRPGFDDESRLAPRGYHVGVGFAPNMSLVRKQGLQLATRIEQYVDIEQIRVDQHEWRIGRAEAESGERGSRFLITVREDRLNVEHFFPGRALERFEQRLLSVLRVFGEVMTPKIIVQSGAMARFTFQLDEDARLYLARRKLRLDQRALRPFGRPAHVIGLRLFFPASVHREDKSLLDWQVNVKIESLAQDPTRLFIEADALWKHPMQWNDDSLPKLVERVDVVQRFVRSNVLAFLKSQDED